MKMLLPLFLLFNCDIKSQNVIIGSFNTDYIIWDTTNLNYGKEVARGYKGDSCIILKYLKSSIGSEWLLVLTQDTVGYAIMEFIDFNKDSLYNLNNSKLTIDRKERSMTFMYASKKDWLAKREANKKKVIAEREKTRTDFKKYIASHTMFILSHSFPEDKYLKYPGFKVSVFNCKTNKTIKYLWFTITGYNPVNDVEGTKTVKAIGPIDPMKLAEYEFENIIASKVIDHCKIQSVKIQYMDGSTATLSQKEIDNMELKASVFLNYVDEFYSK